MFPSRRSFLRLLALSLPAASLCAQTPAGADHITYPAKPGPGAGKHLVFIAGDEEYRSEEGLPMLAKILSQWHGFKCTVLFSLAEDGTIDPNNQKSLSAPQELDSAEGIVILTRFRQWAPDVLQHFTDAVNRGVPIVGLRTATHALTGPAQKPFGDFGKNVLGERWVSHWGKHKSEGTRSVVEPSAQDDPRLRGVGEIFCLSDVYEAYPPADAKILMRGQVVAGMTANDPAATYSKKRSSDKEEQGINDPMMPIVWAREYTNPAGTKNKVFATTMGAATDLESESLRRLIVNAVYDGLGLPVPEAAKVDYVDPYKPGFFSFNGFRKGIRPEDHALGKVLPGEGLAVPAAPAK